MKTNIKKNERVLNLLAHLLRAHRAVSFSEITENVDGYNDRETPRKSIARRFERDKETLRSLGIRLVYVDDACPAPGYMIPTPSAYMAEIDLRDAEVHLLMALAAFGKNRTGPLHDNLASACQKLLARSALKQSENPHDRNVLYSPEASTDKAFTTNLFLLAQAGERRRRVTFTYFSIGRDSTSIRLVEPYGLRYYRGAWYLVGRCREINAVRVFRLNRIQGKVSCVTRGGDGQYDVPADFSILDYVSRNPWELSHNKPVTVTVALDDIGAWLLEDIRPTGLRMAKRDATSVATLDVTNVVAFYKFLLGLGTHAEVLSPEAVRRGYTRFVKEVYDSWQA